MNLRKGMSMDDLISIVLPIYNGEKYMKQSIDSVINQTYANWELLIVDDGSTDNTAAIAREYAEKDNRIKYYKNPQNMRLPKTLNRGFSLATGDYLTWTSDDNYYYPTDLEKMYTTLVRQNAEFVFASCDVIPDIEDDIDIELNDDDLRIDTYRSSGAGGQHINKTSSAVRITHLPTGIVVQCQNERSQLFNKDKAMQMLKAKLYLLKKQEQEEKVSGIRGEVQDINFGSQIRSYILHPYNLVKDHRTGEETGNVSAVLDGELDPFINAYLKQRSNNG